MKNQFFLYGEKEIDHLKKADKRLGKIIDRIGPIKRETVPDLFTALIHSIAGQQISTKAHYTIWQRITSELSRITPEIIDALPDEKFRDFGLSSRKVAYMKSAARKILSGEFDIQALATLPDAEVCEQLTRLEGVGQWTAEMLMIFSMQRPNVLSYQDLAIIRGLRMVYRHRKIDRTQLDRYKKRYSPYASIASLYLWAVAGGALPDLRDPASSNRKTNIHRGKR